MGKMGKQGQIAKVSRGRYASAGKIDTPID
jgi:hypothetical protein